MKKLCDLVDVVINNENCVVFKFKDDVTMDMIALGCFNGTEDMFRMTKGRTPEITVFNKDGSNFSYHFGEGSTTIISENMMQQRTMIRECAILDFGIVCDWSHKPNDFDYMKFVNKTLGLKDLGNAKRVVSLASGGGYSCNIRVNEQNMESSINVKDVASWFEKRGYEVSFDKDITKGLECGQIYGKCVLIDKLLDIALDDVIADAQKRAEKSGPNDDGSGPNGGAGGAPDMRVEPDEPELN